MFLAILLLASVVAEAKTIRIAVIDTGFDFNSDWSRHERRGFVKPKLCKDGHKDFTTSPFNDRPMDYHGHGTHVAGILAKNLKEVDYCIIVFKYYKDGKEPGNLTLYRSNLALLEAIKQKVDYINYSGGGPVPDDVERKLITYALDKGIRVFAAAGNEGKFVSRYTYQYYPAFYDDRIFVVGSHDDTGRRLSSSNFGVFVTDYKPGKNVMSLLPHNSIGPMTGTSQATPQLLSEHILSKRKK